MEIDSLFTNLSLGFSVAVTAQNLFWCLMGAIIGTAIGVLPGVGPVATMALLLPVTYFLPPEGALIMLAGIYYGAQYGGSTTAILVNLPGEASSVVTTLDGYQMARQGRAGPALAIAAIGSFFAGCVATVAIAVAAPPLTKLAQQFAPADYFSLMALGLVFAVVLARGSVIKALGMIFLGMLLGLVGTDVNTGNTRYTFDISDLFDGIGFVPLVMGVFGIAEIMANLTEHGAPRSRQLQGQRAHADQGGPQALDRAHSARHGAGRSARHPARRRSGAGLLFGLHRREKALQDAGEIRHRHDRGRGRPGERQQRRGADLVHSHADAGHPLQRRDGDDDRRHDDPRHRPGPQVMEQKPGLFWGMIVSMWLGNLMLVILNLPLIGIWVRMLLVPYRLLSVAILFFCCIGVYSLNNSANEVLIIALFGVLGYLFMKLDCEPTPLLMGFLLGPMMEVYMRRAMLLSRGDPMGVPGKAAVPDVPSDRGPAPAVRHPTQCQQGTGNGVPGVIARGRCCRVCFNQT